jgi:hypothetical protein
LQIMRAGDSPARILDFSSGITPASGHESSLKLRFGWGGRIRTFACRNQNPVP